MAETLRESCDRWLARLSWTLQGRGNPLRRPVDRKEARLIVGLLVIFLLASPLVAVLGAHLSYAASLRDMHAQRSWHEVTATLMQNATGTSATTSDAWAPLAQARWTPRTGVAGTASSRSTARLGPGSTSRSGSIAAASRP